MTVAKAIADCAWEEPGGVHAARIICTFLDDIGIGVEVAEIDRPMFVPGLTIVEGHIVVDPEIASFPGDLLHEAGHIAVASPERRTLLADVGDDPAEEMTAIAWSVAAARHCALPLDVVFHPKGYKGGSQSLIDNFEGGHTFGVPLLAYYGMTTDATYPEMTRWLR